MDPGRVLGKNMQKLRSCAGAAMAATGILDVGDVALDLLGVLFAQRHPPEFFTGNGKHRLELCECVLVVRESTGVMRAECNADSAGQRGCINEVCRAQLLC